MVLRSTPLLILMGKQSGESRKKKSPSALKNNCWGSTVCAVDYRFGRAVSSALQNKKGRERSPVAFRAAGRAKRGGRSRPFAVLARVPISCTQTRKVLFGEGLKNCERKTVRKSVRKTEFRSVFHSACHRRQHYCLTRLFRFQRLVGDGRG